MSERDARLALVLLAALGLGTLTAAGIWSARQAAGMFRRIGQAAEREMSSASATYREAVMLARYESELD